MRAQGRWMGGSRRSLAGHEALCMQKLLREGTNEFLCAPNTPIGHCPGVAAPPIRQVSNRAFLRMSRGRRIPVLRANVFQKSKLPRGGTGSVHRGITPLHLQQGFCRRTTPWPASSFHSDKGGGGWGPRSRGGNPRLDITSFARPRLDPPMLFFLLSDLSSFVSSPCLCSLTHSYPTGCFVHRPSPLHSCLLCLPSLLSLKPLLYPSFPSYWLLVTRYLHP